MLRGALAALLLVSCAHAPPPPVAVAPKTTTTLEAAKRDECEALCNTSALSECLMAAIDDDEFDPATCAEGEMHECRMACARLQ
jgi:hypothetical protein